MTTVYQIKNWSKVYEKSDHKKVKTITWVSTPTDLNSLGRLKIMAQPNGFEIMGVWEALVALAAGAPVEHRGQIVNGDGEPYSVEEIALKIHGPMAVIERCLPTLLSIGWLIASEIETMTAQTGHPEDLRASPETSGGSPSTSGNFPTTGQDRTHPDRTGEEGARAREGSPDSPPEGAKPRRGPGRRAEPPPDDAPEGVIRTWCRLWEERHGTEYDPGPFCVKDGIQLAKSLGRDRLDLIEPAMRAFQGDPKTRLQMLNKFCRVAAGLIAAEAAKRKPASRASPEEDDEPPIDEATHRANVERYRQIVSGIGTLQEAGP